MWLLSIPFYLFIFCHFQSGDQGLEWSLQLYHPPQPDGVPREKHASLQTASHMLEAHTAMQNTSEKMEQFVWKGDSGARRTLLPWWIRGSDANCPSNLRDSRVGGDSLRFWYQETKLLNFLDMLGGGLLLSGENHCSSCWEGKTQIHTGAKSQSWTVLRPKVRVNLHPSPTGSNQNHTSSPLKRLDLLFKNIKNNHTKAESRRYFNIQECEWQTNKAK